MNRASRLVAPAEGVPAPHEAFRGGADAAEAQRRAEWFDTHGW